MNLFTTHSIIGRPAIRFGTLGLAFCGVFCLTTACGDAADLTGAEQEHILGDACSGCDTGQAEPTPDDTGSGRDATLDTASPDIDGIPEDAAEDSGVEDAGVEDVGVEDTGSDDDLGQPEEDVVDTGEPDAGPTLCNNGVLDPGETCDNDCPANCDDGLNYTSDVMSGSAAWCTISCAHADSGLDTDFDGLSDYIEINDGIDGTNPWVFNGMVATIGTPPSGFFTSADCGLFFGKDFGDMMTRFDQSEQSHAISAGFDWSAGNSAEYDDPTHYDFVPGFEHHDNVGVHNSFQIHLHGALQVDTPGTWCFSVDTGAKGFGPLDIAGRRNNCGRVFVNPSAGSSPLAETGYGSAESPQTGCVELTAGEHALHFAARHYETHLYGPRFGARYCFGGDAGCTPDQAFTQPILFAQAPGTCAPVCTGSPDCADDGCGGTCGNCDGPPPCTDPDGCDDPCTDPDGCDDPCTNPDGCDDPSPGACTNSGDKAIIDSLGADGMQDAITPCGSGCFFSSDKEGCVTECINSDVGLSEPCAGCYGAVTACTMDNCAGACIDGGDDCITCMSEAGCQDNFPACSGIADTP